MSRDPSKTGLSQEQEIDDAALANVAGGANVGDALKNFGQAALGVGAAVGQETHQLMVAAGTAVAHEAHQLIVDLLPTGEQVAAAHPSQVEAKPGDQQAHWVEAKPADQQPHWDQANPQILKAMEQWTPETAMNNLLHTVDPQHHPAGAPPDADASLSQLKALDAEILKIEEGATHMGQGAGSMSGGAAGMEGHADKGQAGQHEPTQQIAQQSMSSLTSLSNSLEGLIKSEETIEKLIESEGGAGSHTTQQIKNIP